jgi:hypothetical protein
VGNSFASGNAREIGQDRDVLGQDAVIGLECGHLTARVDLVLVLRFGLLALRQIDELRLVRRAGFFERDVRRHRAGAGGVIERQHGGSPSLSIVIPGRRAAASPEPIFQRLVFMDSGPALRASRNDRHA